MSLETAVGGDDTSRESVSDNVKKIIARELSISTKEIREDSTLGNLGADSLDANEILMEVEDAYDINLPSSYSPKTVGEFVDEIMKYTAKK